MAYSHREVTEDEQKGYPLPYPPIGRPQKPRKQLLRGFLSRFILSGPICNFICSLPYGTSCSGSTTVGVGLANGGQFGLTLCDKGLGGRLLLNDNGLTLTESCGA